MADIVHLTSRDSLERSVRRFGTRQAPFPFRPHRVALTEAWLRATFPNETSTSLPATPAERLLEGLCETGTPAAPSAGAGSSRFNQTASALILALLLGVGLLAIVA